MVVILLSELMEQLGRRRSGYWAEAPDTAKAS
jgi:hypothetical protein